jgi:MoxR-like ATPase
MFTYASEDERAVLRAYSDLQPPPHPLTPVQERARDAVLAGLRALDIVVLQGDSGAGKTLILKAVADSAQGVITGLAQFMELLKSDNPIAIEEVFIQSLDHSLDSADLVIVDDLHLILQIVTHYNYTRH